MNKNTLKYYFNLIEKCNMCGDSAHNHYVIGKRLNKSQGMFPRKKRGITTTIVRCGNCGLIYSNPQPIPFDIQDHYGVPPEEYWHESYFEANDNYFKAVIARFQSLYVCSGTVKALDIGAGLGAAMRAMQSSGFDTYGFEPSEPFYNKAISKMGISPDKIRLGSIEQMEYPENTFDFISCGAVLEHIYDPGESIVTALKWLKPGGLIQIEVPSSSWLIHRFYNLFYKMTGSDYCGNLSPMHPPYHLYEFHINSFNAHATKHGYEIVFKEYYVCETYMPKIADLILVPFMRLTNTGMQLSVWLRKSEN
jgi:SAM-dependent methyltransferase